MDGPVSPFWIASASVLSSVGNAAPPHIRVALSGISSSISLACWIVLLLPQLIEQWRLKSSEGISPIFIGIWFIGDLCSLAGSIWAGLLDGVILLSFWFCLTDALMFLSYFYYKQAKFQNNHVIRRRSTFGHYVEEGNNPAYPSTQASAAPTADPSQPLLNRRDSASTSGPSYTEPTHSTRRKSSKKHRRDSLASIIDAPASTTSVIQQYALPLLFVAAAGAVGYLFSDQQTQNQNPDDGDDQNSTSLGPEILGYLSAALYLGARIPQIIQNYRKKSVYGLSLLFFLFSIMGNISYAGGILFYRSDWEYVKVYIPWLLGSLGTVSEDIIIIIQFFVYGPYIAPSNDSAILEE